MTVKMVSRDEIIDSFYKRNSYITYAVVWNKMFSHALLEDNSFRGYKISEDVDYRFRIYMKVNEIIWVNRVLYYYVMRDSSIVHNAVDWVERYSCHTDIRYRNFMEMPPEMRQRYSHYVLKDLYRKMAEYKFISRGTPEHARACKCCAEYIRDTRKAYWHKKKISVFEKILSTLQLQFPFIVGWLTALRRIVRPQPKLPQPISG